MVVSSPDVIHIGRACGAALPGIGRDVRASVAVLDELFVPEVGPVRWERGRASALASPWHQPGPSLLSPPWCPGQMPVMSWCHWAHILLDRARPTCLAR